VAVLVVGIVIAIMGSLPQFFLVWARPLAFFHAPLVDLICTHCEAESSDVPNVRNVPHACFHHHILLIRVGNIGHKAISTHWLVSVLQSTTVEYEGQGYP